MVNDMGDAAALCEHGIVCWLPMTLDKELVAKPDIVALHRHVMRLAVVHDMAKRSGQILDAICEGKRWIVGKHFEYVAALDQGKVRQGATKIGLVCRYDHELRAERQIGVRRRAENPVKLMLGDKLRLSLHAGVSLVL